MIYKVGKIIFKILIVSSILLVIAFFVLVRKQKDYYYFKFEPQIAYYSKDSTNTEVVLTLKTIKEFVSKENSKRSLLSSIEPGIHGIAEKIDGFSLFLIDREGKIERKETDFFSENIQCLKTEDMGGSQSILYSNNISLSNFIKNANDNVDYTTGLSFYNSDLYFVMHSKKELLDNKKIVFEYISDKVKHRKVIDPKYRSDIYLPCLEKVK